MALRDCISSLPRPRQWIGGAITSRPATISRVLAPRRAALLKGTKTAKDGGLTDLAAAFRLAGESPEPLSDAVFVSIDLEWAANSSRPAKERTPWRITEVGIATLDTRDIFKQAYLNRPPERLLRTRHFKVSYYPRGPHVSIATGTQACVFAKTLYISKQDLPSVLEHCLQLQDSRFPGRLRNLIVLGHSLSGDLKALSSHGINLCLFAPVISMFDTQEMVHKLGGIPSASSPEMPRAKVMEKDQAIFKAQQVISDAHGAIKDTIRANRKSEHRLARRSRSGKLPGPQYRGIDGLFREQPLMLLRAAEALRAAAMLGAVGPHKTEARRIARRLVEMEAFQAEKARQVPAALILSGKCRAAGVAKAQPLAIESHVPRTKLRDILDDLGCSYKSHELHNAGNDAKYTLHALLALAAKHAELISSKGLHVQNWKIVQDAARAEGFETSSWRRKPTDAP